MMKALARVRSAEGIGALFYLVGTFLVTALGNVPLNDQLAAVSATDPAALTCGSKM